MVDVGQIKRRVSSIGQSECLGKSKDQGKHMYWSPLKFSKLVTILRYKLEADLRSTERKENGILKLEG